MKPEALFLFARNLGLWVELGSENEFTIRRYKSSAVIKTMQVHVSFKQLISGNALIQACIELVHELGHYLNAPKGRRHRKDYGIPSEGKRSIKSKHRWDLDEAKAILVETHLLRHFEFQGHAKIRKRPLDPLIQLRYVKNEANRWWREEGENYINTVLANPKLVK